jgi:predicted ATPase
MKSGRTNQLVGRQRREKSEVSKLSISFPICADNETLEALFPKEALARQEPVPMILEDGHWIDPTSLGEIVHYIDVGLKTIPGSITTIGALKSLDYF